ncbi:hypothetical protein KSP40_PGU013055 [Platanthera guangdongensis]|uniref:Uncharacterized protein n=1 Tax=Platanthera guangdongensis TaxID=2320717 RepID=A0ABR2LNN1_9ASPA
MRWGAERDRASEQHLMSVFSAMHPANTVFAPIFRSGSSKTNTLFSRRHSRESLRFQEVSEQFGFHRPPFNSVNHLHLHCFALPFTPRGELGPARLFENRPGSRITGPTASLTGSGPVFNKGGFKSLTGPDAEPVGGPIG